MSHPLVRLLGCSACGFLSLLSAADSPPTPTSDHQDSGWEAFWDALTGGTARFGATLRYEGVDQEGIDERANALNIEAHLSYETAPFLATTALIEYESVSALVEDFNSTANGRTEYPVVADPEATEINRLQLQNKSLRDTTLTLGRQRIIWDNARFIGNVGWRLNEQTFDAFRVENTAIEHLRIDAFLLANVHTVTATNASTEHGLLGQAAYTFEALGTLTGYLHLIDWNEDQNARTDLRTVGARFTGSQAFADDWTIHYVGEFAQQAAYADSDDLSALYYHLMAGVAWKGSRLSLGYEVLGSDDGDAAFQTPLGTNHAFNGWADKFLTTPAAGLTDLYLQLDLVCPHHDAFKGIIAYHLFRSDEGSSDYGEEIDLQVTWQCHERVSLGAKAALYAADEFATDTSKFWLWTTVNF